MTAQHTPGPWQLAEFDLRPGVHRIRTDERNIADVFISEGVPETVANAHLVKAAPRMLKALMEAQLTIDWFRRMALDRQNPREFDPMAWTQAKQSNRQAVAAIRAATGEDDSCSLCGHQSVGGKFHAPNCERLPESVRWSTGEDA